MKTMKRNILTALLFASMTTFANTTTTFDNIKRVKVEFTAVKKGHSLEIKDENGTTIYTEQIEKEGDFSRTFDLTALKDGNFTAELSKDFEIIVKPFTVEDGTVTFITESEKTIFKPILRKEENRILVSKYNFESTKLDVKIYFEDNLIHTEVLEGENFLNRVYALSKEERGSYRIVINTDGKSYEKSFNL